MRFAELREDNIGANTSKYDQPVIQSNKLEMLGILVDL